ncbi:hypothetical protein QBC39DRAFT_74167 [Podospora conica]|nr:hypothetical protein QBC39DRAFT_74167 [Schizothecium conicum]
MVSFRSLALIVAVGYVSAQEISTLDPCAKTCLDKANELFNQFSCAAGDIFCMCPKGDWKNAINDCAKAACPADYAPTVTNAVNALCATAAPPPPPAAAVPTTSAPPPPAAEPTTTPPATTAPPTSSSSPSPSSTSQTEAAKLSNTSTAPSTSSTSTPTKSTPTGASTTSAAPTSTTEPAAAIGGMTTATKIGVGVGVTAAIAALIGAGVFFILRRRQQSRNIGGAKHWKISEPMPSPSSRHYENDDFGQSYETGLSDLEMKSRRYEDMVPRQKPRQMV